MKTPVKTPGEILRLLAIQPQMTLAEVAATIGKSLSAVERASAKLTKEGCLRYVGPRKGGRWEVLGDGHK
ncbi:MAG: winged helix-turn-helix domain-containing protein [Deltaproteobacteria bacterium]